jgi:hypothetical protein
MPCFDLIVARWPIPRRFSLEFAARFLKHLHDGVSLDSFQEREVRIERFFAGCPDLRDGKILGIVPFRARPLSAPFCSCRTLPGHSNPVNCSMAGLKP